MTSVLISGGTGFIGSRLARRCLDAGDSVRALGRKNNPAEAQNASDLEDIGVEVVDVSVTDKDALIGVCSGVDVVYHLAAAQHEANVADRHFYEVNVEGTRNLLEAANVNRVGRFVHGSTIGVYGMGSNGTVTDDTALKPDNIYGITKLKGEAVVAEFSSRMPIAVARISETYGPGDRRLLKLFRGVQKGRLVRIGNGENLHHLVFIEDLLDGLRLAATSGRVLGKTFVLAGPEAIPSDEMISEISRVLGKRPPKVRIPLWPLLWTAFFMEGVLKPLGIQPPLHRRRMNFFIKSFNFDMKRVEEEIGFRPKVGFLDGARRTAEWYKKEGLL